MEGIGFHSAQLGKAALLRRRLSTELEAAGAYIAELEAPVAEAKRAYEAAVERMRPALEEARRREAAIRTKRRLLKVLTKYAEREGELAATLEDPTELRNAGPGYLVLYPGEDAAFAEVVAGLAEAGLCLEMERSRRVLELRICSRYSLSRDCDLDAVGWGDLDPFEEVRFRPDGSGLPDDRVECERSEELARRYKLEDLQIRDVDYDGDHHGLWARAWAGLEVTLVSFTVPR
jgi:hypothetical protein